jgi:hypothetical protein
VKTITTGADFMNTNPSCVRSTAFVVAENDALPVSCTRRSNSSSPVSKIRASAVGVSVHSLIAIRPTKSPPRESSPHSVELIFEGELRVAPLLDESLYISKGLGFAWFEPFGVVQDEVIVL